MLLDLCIRALINNKSNKKQNTIIVVISTIIFIIGIILYINEITPHEWVKMFNNLWEKDTELKEYIEANKKLYSKLILVLEEKRCKNILNKIKVCNLSLKISINN